jgi:hypothetical protein
MNSLAYVLRRINSRSLSLLLSFLLILGGLWLICLDIRSEGYIDIKALTVSGRLNFGHVGLGLIFLGAIICIICVIVKAKSTTQIKFGDLQFRGKGYISEEYMERLNQLIKDLQQSGQSKKGD